MKFTTKEDIEAPIDQVFNAVSDFPSFERSALRRGAEVSRVDTFETSQVGSAWDIAFKFRGKERALRATLAEFDAPNSLVADIVSKGIGGVTRVGLVPLSRSRTRLNVEIELTPKSLAAKLLFKSMSLAKGNMNKRLARRVADFAEDIEDQFRKAT
ncbi:MAG: hypothetical protein ACI86S_001766 [Paracoccaceae bacterium]|jgi:hypothetical protein